MPSLEALGWGRFFEDQLTPQDASLVPARVAEEARGLYRLLLDKGEWWGEPSGAFRHVTTKRADLPAVGDWVMVQERPKEERATIRRVLTRRSKFSRLDTPRERPKSLNAEEQVVAANVNIVLLVTSLKREFSLQRIERYLVLAWDSGANPVVVLSKADLCDDPGPWRTNAESAALGVQVLITSAVRGDGLDELRRLVRDGGTCALLGSSGVGKSSLINALLEEPRQQVKPIRSDDDRGRHSTTSRQLLMLPTGGIVIDTPGMRELQIRDSGAGLEHAFTDVEGFAEQCRFADCSHGTEPGCGVRAAVSSGQLSQQRLASYHKLLREERFLETKTDLGGQDRSRPVLEAGDEGTTARLRGAWRVALSPGLCT